MVWPFSKREDNSPDSFERVLAKLSSQIQAQTSTLALFRQRSRRYKGLFTLYTVFGWILYVVVVVLVVGWKEVGPPEIAGLVGGPVGIWSVRMLLDLYYNNRIGNAESKLDYLQKKQRDTVEKLKAATKFSTTQSIIEKYGGGSTSSDADKKKQPQGGPQGTPGQQVRQRPQGPPPAPTTPQQIQQQLIQQQLMEQQRAMQLQHPTGNPNSVQKSAPPAPPAPPVINLPKTTTQPSSQQHIQAEEATEPRWYDRLLDVLVGEDETSAKNRYALICKNCRMVNGLAPPGTRSLDDMEGWGCARCGTMNGRTVSRPQSRASSKLSSRPPSSLGEELTPEMEPRRSKRGKSPAKDENVRTTRRAKKEVVDSEESESESEESAEEVLSGSESEIPEPPKAKSKAKVVKGTRGSKKA